MKIFPAIALCLSLAFVKPARSIECSEENGWCFLPTMVAIYVSAVVLNGLEQEIHGWWNDYYYRKSLANIKDGLPQFLTSPKTTKLDFSYIDDSTKIIHLASQMFEAIAEIEERVNDFNRLKSQDLQEPHFSLLAAFEIVNFWLLADAQYGDGATLSETQFNDFLRTYQYRFSDEIIMAPILRSSLTKFQG
jgi:hypothetical protein